MAEASKYRARILGRREMTVYTVDMVPVPTMEVTYSTPHLTPNLIRIPLAEYSLETEGKTIHEDIDRRHEETTRALATLTLELAETRGLIERRGARRRRGSSSSTDDVPAIPIAFQQTLAENVQRDMDSMREQVAELGDRIERALAPSRVEAASSPERGAGSSVQSAPDPEPDRPATGAPKAASTPSPPQATSGTKAPTKEPAKK